MPLYVVAKEKGEGEKGGGQGCASKATVLVVTNLYYAEEKGKREREKEGIWRMWLTLKYRALLS